MRLSDHMWVNLMHEELANFERNQVWELVDPPLGCKPIGTKCDGDMGARSSIR
jgi:hypothetical protein